MLLFRPGGFEHHGTQIRSGIGFRKVHRAGRAGRHPRQELLFDFLGSEFVQRLGAVLQAPDVLEAGIGAGHHFVGHHEAYEREVQTVVLAGQRESAQPGIDNGFHVLDSAGSVFHMVVHYARAFVVDPFGVGRNDVAAHFAGDFQHATVGVHRVVEILRCVVVEVFLGEAALLQLHDLAHHRMLEVELQILVI